MDPQAKPGDDVEGGGNGRPGPIAAGAAAAVPHSHSMVPGGFEVTS